MSNLIIHAKKELELAGYFDKEKDFYQGMTGNAVLELIEVFAKQGHSGMSSSLVINLFKELASFNPINPIYCTDEEWEEVEGDMFQNNRLSSVFKDGKNGRPYFLNAIVWQYEDGGAFTGTVENITSRQFIKLPFLPKTFYINVTNGNGEENSENKIIDRKQLNEAFEYYLT